MTAVKSRLAPSILFLLLSTAALHAQLDPLPSWNDGPAKQAIINLVRTTTDPQDPDFVPLEERFATFDQDGTTWAEHPNYTKPNPTAGLSLA